MQVYGCEDDGKGGSYIVMEHLSLGGERLGGLVFKAHRWLYHSTLGSRVIQKKKKSACKLATNRRGLRYAMRQGVEECRNF